MTAIPAVTFGLLPLATYILSEPFADAEEEKQTAP